MENKNLEKKNPWAEKFKDDFGIFYQKYFDKIKKLVNRNPKKTFIIMICFGCLNLILVVILSNRKKDDLSYGKAIKDSYTHTKLNPANEESFSLSKIVKVEKLKNRLEALKAKKQFDRSDSLEFIEIVNEFQAIDPQLINNVKNRREKLVLDQLSNMQKTAPTQISQGKLDSIKIKISNKDPLKNDKEEIIKRQEDINKQLQKLQEQLKNHTDEKK